MTKYVLKYEDGYHTISGTRTNDIFEAQWFDSAGYIRTQIEQDNGEVVKINVIVTVSPPTKAETKPITPREVLALKNTQTPPEIFEAFNELIAKNWNGHSSVFTLKEVTRLAAKKLGVKVEKVCDENYFDVEDHYRKSGWEVEYDQPGYNESYQATFTFKKKRG